MLAVGITHRLEVEVLEADTARAVGSGGLDVLATPRLAALMEQACFESVEPLLEVGKTSVGSHLDIKHQAPSLVGSRIAVESLLEAVDGRQLTFSLRATDAAGIIAEAIHERFIVDTSHFLNRAAHRTKKNS